MEWFSMLELPSKTFIKNQAGLLSPSEILLFSLKMEYSMLPQLSKKSILRFLIVLRTQRMKNQWKNQKLKLNLLLLPQNLKK